MIGAVMPGAIGSVDELAEEVAALDVGEWRAVAVERVLAALVRLRHREPERLAAALRPVLERGTRAFNPSWHGGATVRDAAMLLGTALRVAAGLPASRAIASRILLGGSPEGMAGAVAVRLAEVAVRLDARPVPELVSAPSLASGIIAPGELAERLARAERDGWVPWTADLQQARYRLPPAGPEPSTRVVRVHGDGGRSRFYAEVTPGEDVADPSGLLRVRPPKRMETAFPGDHWSALWPAVLPGRPEVVAAHLLPTVAAATDAGRRHPAGLLPLLGELPGTVGTVTAAAVAYGLGAPRAADRVEALDALLAVAGRVDGAEVGGWYARLPKVPLSRLLPSLRDVAAGDPGLAARIAAGAAERLRTAGDRPRGLTELLGIAAAGGLSSGPLPGTGP